MPLVSALNTLSPEPIFIVTPSIDPAVIVPKSAFIADRSSTLIFAAVTLPASILIAVTAFVAISEAVTALAAIEP